MTTDILSWLRSACAQYKIEPVAIYRTGTNPVWPITAASEGELRAKLEEGGHFLPLPKEPAALANVIEVSLVDYLAKCIESAKGAEFQRGTERGYPDLEIFGSLFGDKYHAVDVKVARRNKARTATESRITLYTGNTYFRHPTLQWPGMFRPFDDYQSHLDIIVLYTLNEMSAARIEDLELIVQETWRVASKQRSSTTREYLGAVTNIEALRAARGEFATKEEFYRFWRKHPFKIGRAVEQQLSKLLRENSSKNR